MDVKELGRQAATQTVAIKQANLGRIIGTAGSRLGGAVGRGLGRGIGWLTGQGLSVGGRAAAKTMTGAGRGVAALARRSRKVAPQAASATRTAVVPMAKHPFTVGVPSLAGMYAAGEGLYSLGQGNESLGRQWDQTVTKGLYQGGRLGQAREYLKRLLIRPTSTLYGTVFGFPKPGVSAETSSKKWQPGSGGELTRTVEQQGQKPYWLLVRDKQFLEARRQEAEQFRKRQQELGELLDRFREEKETTDTARQRELESLRRQYEAIDVVPEASPDLVPGPAENKLEQYQKLRQAVSQTPSRRTEPSAPSPSSPGPRRNPEDPSRPRGGGDLSGLLLAAGVPAAAMLASRKNQDDEEEKLRKALRRYHQA